MLNFTTYYLRNCNFANYNYYLLTVNFTHYTRKYDLLKGNFTSTQFILALFSIDLSIIERLQNIIFYRYLLNPSPDRYKI